MTTKMPGAACVLILRPSDGKVLAVPRKYDAEQFGLPGGKIDPGETPEAAAIRETLEETGLIVKLLALLYEGVCEGEVSHYTWTYFAVAEGEGEQKEREKAVWVPWSRLFDGPFRAYNQRVFDAFRERVRASATRTGLLKMRK